MIVILIMSIDCSQYYCCFLLFIINVVDDVSIVVTYNMYAYTYYKNGNQPQVSGSKVLNSIP